jgi:aromatic ring-opening dioxygenase catalytic subunit (LigB family)
MAEIVFAAGVPHAPALVGLYDRAPSDARQIISRSYQAVQTQLKRTRPDVLIVFANDHLTNSRIRAYPDFLIAGAREHRGPHEWFKPWIGCRDYVVPGHPTVAEALFRGMTRRGIRMNLNDAPLKFDDNLSVPVVMTQLDETGLPVVPVLQNCTVPPYPDGPRCFDVGRALADLIRHDLPASMRVALLGSGGLSHEPGGARYYKIDEEFDRSFLDLCVKGDHEALLTEMTAERMEAAGMGGTPELLAWFVVMAAIGECRGESFGYTGWTNFRCGFGAVIWDLDSQQKVHA